jgi:hypothetical protein
MNTFSGAGEYWAEEYFHVVFKLILLVFGAKMKL